MLAIADSAEVETSFFDRRRLAFCIIAASATAILAIILFIPAAARMFSLSRPEPFMLGATPCVALVAGGWYGFLRRAGLVRPAGYRLAATAFMVQDELGSYKLGWIATGAALIDRHSGRAA